MILDQVAARRTLLAQGIGLVAALLLMTFLRNQYVFDFDNAGFGTMTAAVHGEADGGRIHCNYPDNSELCEQTLPRATIHRASSLTVRSRIVARGAVREAPRRARSFPTQWSTPAPSTLPLPCDEQAFLQFEGEVFALYHRLDVG